MRKNALGETKNDGWIGEEQYSFYIIDKKAKSKAKKQAEEVEEKVETEQTVQAEETTSEEDKPKKTKRPNRGSKSKGRKTTSKKNSNDEE